MKKIICFLFLVLVFALAYFLYQSFWEINWKLFYERDVRFIEGTLASFWGAIIAFLILIADRFLSSIHDRQKKNRTTLAMIEIFLAEYRSILDINLAALGNLEMSLTDNQPSVAAFKLHQMTIDKSLCEPLTNDEYLNNFFRFLLKAGTLNNDYEVVSGEYSRLKELLLSKVIDFGQFKENTQWMNPQIVDLIALIKRFDAQILELIAETRVLRKTSENPLSLIFRWLVITSKHPKNFKILVDNELRNLKKELGI